MVKVLKEGEKPFRTVVLTETVEFDADGIADVSEEIADILKQVPGFSIVETSEVKEQEEAAALEPATPKRTVPKAKPAPKKG